MPNRSERTALEIHGMDCAEEAAILKREVGPLVGAADVALMSDDLSKLT